MFKRRTLLTALIVCVLVLFMALPAWAVKASTLGNLDPSGRDDDTYDIEITDDPIITFNAGVASKYELCVTNNVIAATETGTTFIAQRTVAADTEWVRFTLPTAVAGYEFSFIAGDDIVIMIDPQDTDAVLLALDTTEDEMQAGDALQSPGATGDSITLISPIANYWAVKSRVGTWLDADGI